MTTLPTVLTARIPHRSGNAERVPCEPVAPTVMKLTGFAQQAPLAPGDWVTVGMDGVATVVTPAEGWLVELHLSGFMARDAQQALVDSWNIFGVDAVLLTEVGNVARAFAEDRTLLEEIAESDGVDVVFVERHPGDAVDLPWDDDADAPLETL